MYKTLMNSNIWVSLTNLRRNGVNTTTTVLSGHKIIAYPIHGLCTVISFKIVPIKNEICCCHITSFYILLEGGGRKIFDWSFTPGYILWDAVYLCHDQMNCKFPVLWRCTVTFYGMALQHNNHLYNGGSICSVLLL